MSEIESSIRKWFKGGHHWSLKYGGLPGVESTEGLLIAKTKKRRTTKRLKDTDEER